ncbi:MAG: AraC family transcriptional regulator [Lachnospiraceae bacterium]|nr:AraC family transcriptional regulator [Lachnospiraceae bacterium]
MKIRLKDNQLEEIEGLSPDYPYVYHYANLSATKIPWHWHEELEFNYVVSGKVKLITPNETYLFHKNEGFFINSNVLCTMEQELPAVMDSHLFHPVFLYGHFKSVFATKYVEPVLQNKKLEILEIRGVNRRQREMLVKLKGAAYLQKREDTEFQTRNLFSEIWLLLLEEMKQQDFREAPDTRMNQERIQFMMAFIQQNYQKKISLEDIALSASVSKRECLRCFRNCIHKTPFEYLQDYRIEMAKRLLRTTDLPAMQVALQAGFSNGAYFGKIFKSICGQTPGEYRKIQKQ